MIQHFMALSNDIRNRVVDAYCNNEGTLKKIAERFSVGVESVKRWIKRKRDTGTIERKLQSGRPSKIPPKMYTQLYALVAQNADATLKQLADKWYQKFGVKISISPLNQTLKKAGITYKKNFSSSRTAVRKIPNTTPRIFEET